MEDIPNVRHAKMEPLSHTDESYKLSVSTMQQSEVKIVTLTNEHDSMSRLACMDAVP